MKNLSVVFFIPSIGIKIMILVLSNKILVLFDKSIRISLAYAHAHTQVSYVSHTQRLEVRGKR